MRLGEFIQGAGKIANPHKNIFGRENDVVDTFLGVNTYLKTSTSFPNKSVNELHEYIDLLIISGALALAEAATILDTPTHVSVTVSKDPAQTRWEKITLGFSSDYASFVQTQPIYGLLQATLSASLIRDFVQDKFDPEGSWARAFAYRAETGSTIQQLAEYEELTNVPPLAKALPLGKGLNFLDMKYRYDLQPLQPPIRFGINILSRN